jgi:hypothetical protein
LPDPLDDPPAAQGAQGEAGEIAAEHEAGHGRPEVLDRHPQGDKGAEESVGELDEARRDDQRPDLRAHRHARPHRTPFLLAADQGEALWPSRPNLASTASSARRERRSGSSPARRRYHKRDQDRIEAAVERPYDCHMPAPARRRPGHGASAPADGPPYQAKNRSATVKVG